MSKETKVMDRNGDERIIKRNKTKIGIITLVVLILLSLIGIGIYFIVVSFKKYDYDPGWEEASITEVRDEVLDNDKKIAVYFYLEKGSTSNFMLRNNTVYGDGESGTGAMAEVIDSTSDNLTWYGVKIPEENELIEELLSHKIKTNNDKEVYTFYDEFEYLSSGTSLRNNMWMIDSLDGGAEEDYEVVDQAYDSFSLQVDTNEDAIEDKDDDNERDILFYDTSSTKDNKITSRESTGTDYSVKDGTTMFFNGTQITSVVNGWSTVSIDDEDEDDSDTTQRDEYHSNYVNWIKELVEHNNDFFS